MVDLGFRIVIHSEANNEFMLPTKKGCSTWNIPFLLAALMAGYSTMVHQLWVSSISPY